MFAGESGSSHGSAPAELLREVDDDFGGRFVRAVDGAAWIGTTEAIGVQVEGGSAVAVVHGPWCAGRSDGRSAGVGGAAVAVVDAWLLG